MKRPILIVTVALMLAGAWWEFRFWWEGPGPSVEPTLVTVAAGASLSSIARQLEEQGVLQYARVWQWTVRARGEDGSVKRGEYLLQAGISPMEILQALVEGKVLLYGITLPEGITLGQAIDLLHGHEVLEATLSGPKDQRLIDLVRPHSNGEGLFFPDTYRFSRGDSDLSVLKTAYARMSKQLQEAWSARDASSPFETPYEALIMASLVEKETGVPEERGQIAGVFLRRLEKGMRLQTDPTIIYGLGESFDGNLRRSHLRDSSNPYNTYRHGGLPPTPIALPGRAALDAALAPETGTALYFVARGDGSHQFSDTLEEHQKAVRTWQLKRVKNYRSSPAATDSQP